MKNYISVRKLDGSGRIVIPKRIRSKLNINSNSLLKIRLIKNKIIIDLFNKG